MVDDFATKVRRLVQRLLIATDRNQLSWNETDRSHAYVCQLPSQDIVVATVDDDGQAPHELQVFLKDGSLGEEINPDEVRLTREIKELHAAARRSSRGVNDILDTLLAEVPADDVAQY